MLISHEELFLETVNDLRTKVHLNTPYSIIRACGLCRHLILDQHPLVTLANKNYKLPITFHIKDYTDTPLSYEYKGQGARTILPLGESKVVKLTEFLKTKIIHVNRHEFTVREMIMAASHYFGGVHSAKPEPKEEYLSLFHTYAKAEMKTSFWLLGTICQVVLKSIEPLETEIKKAFTGGFSPQSSAA